MMRRLDEPDIAALRNVVWEIAAYGVAGDEHEGCFVMKSPIDGADLACIASTGAGWDHVSVSRRNRCPNWAEMEAVKRRFFRDDETAMQLHVPPDQHISVHPFCLHLWRPNDGRDIPRPPGIMVGPSQEDAA
jgi:hypothetical protein